MTDRAKRVERENGKQVKTISGTRGPVSIDHGAFLDNSTPYFAAGDSAFAEDDYLKGIRFFVEGDVKVGDGPLLNANSPARPSVLDALLNAYRSRGECFFQDLAGSFRLALWDAEERTLFLATDPMGTRPVYYHDANGRLTFAPKVSSIASLPDICTSIDPNVLYFFANHSFIPAPYSIYREIRRLEPGQCLIWRNGAININQYWDIHYDEDASLSAASACDLIRSSVECSVRSLLEAQGLDGERIGAFLSGGTDSSTLVGLMSQIGKRRVKSFSVGFAEERYNEIDYARIAAACFNAKAQEYFVSANDALDAVPTLAAHFDEPFANASAIPTYFCLREAKNAGVQVMFAGDGGDELFAGNERYLGEKYFLPFDILPARLQALARGVGETLPSIYPISKVKRYIERAGEPNPDRFFYYHLYIQQHRDRYLTDDFRASLDPEFPLRMPRRHFWKVATAAPLNRLLYMDLKMCIADNDLFKVNRMAEASGVKVCYPYLDRNLAEMTGRIPARLKLKGTEKRYIFKKAFKQLLPKAIRHKTKHGFGLPVAHWLRSHSGFKDLARALLLDTKPVQRGYFKRNALEGLLQKHDQESSDFYGTFIWHLMMLELWHQRHWDHP